MSTEPAATELEAQRQAFMAERIDTWFFERTDAQPHSTLYIQILDELTRDVARRASAAQRRAPEIVQKLWFNSELVLSPLQSIGRDGGRDGHLHFWRHIAYPPEQAGGQLFPIGPYDLKDIEEVAANYLAQPARSALLTRTLVDILVAYEVFSLANAFYDDPAEQGRTPHQLGRPLRLPLLRAIGVALLQMLGLCGAFGLVITAMVFADLPIDLYVQATIVGVVFLGFLLKILFDLDGVRQRVDAVPALRPPNREGTRVQHLLARMYAVYAALEHEPNISDIQPALQTATEVGAVWSPLLWPLLAAAARDEPPRSS